jgi:hypothetical protein
MKLQSVMNRSVAKEGTDLLDIVRLLLDPVTRRVAVSQLHQVSGVMAEDIRLHARHWFIENRDHTIRRIRAINQGAAVDEASLDVISALLLDE